MEDTTVKEGSRYKGPPAIKFSYGYGSRCPRRKRLLLPGDKKVSGFADRPTAEELRKRERI